MKKTFFVRPLGLGAALLLSTVPAFAQPDPNNAPKGENPPNWQRGQNNMRDVTPQQREAFMKQRREQGMRRLMTMAEITDKMSQDAILAFTEAEEKARGPIREAGQKVVMAMGAGAMGQPKADDAAIATLMQAYRDAVKADEARRTAALDALDNSINWRTMPRVDAFLTLMGYTAEPGLMSGGMGGMMGGGMGGGMMGMMGGGPGGRGGSQGGRAGGQGGRRGGGQGGGQGGRRGNNGGGGNNAGGNNAAPAPAPPPVPADEADED